MTDTYALDPHTKFSREITKTPFSRAFSTDLGYFPWLEGAAAAAEGPATTGVYGNRFRLARFGKAMTGTSGWETPGAVFQGGSLSLSLFLSSSSLIDACEHRFRLGLVAARKRRRRRGRGHRLDEHVARRGVPTPQVRHPGAASRRPTRREGRSDLVFFPTSCADVSVSRLGERDVQSCSILARSSSKVRPSVRSFVR